MSTIETDPPKAERHLAAILATDVVGYSRQMERDEVETLRRLRDLRQNLIEPKVAEHRGRIFKTMGDGFLAEFRSALDAVHCAVDIQRLMAARNLDLPEDGRLQLRIGINLGDVFHEGEDVFGDGVNIAARLESIAPPGGIYVSRAACDPIRERFAFDFEDLGEHRVKNITRPIQVFGVRIDATAAPLSKPAPPKRNRLLIGSSVAVILGMAVATGWHFGLDRQTSRLLTDTRAVGTNTATVPRTPSALIAEAKRKAHIELQQVGTGSDHGIVDSSPHHKEAARWLQIAAELGDPEAQYDLASLQGPGMLDAPDDNEAVRWYRKAAEQGFVKAYSDLSSLLKKTDPAESLKWLRLSAEHDDPQSAYELALRYSMGRGAVQSQDEAVRWLRRSAELGYNVAEYELALLYERGAGLPRDLIKARQIMEKFLPRIPLGKGR